MAVKEIWPNFIVIGPPKAGTTSLFYYLKQHSQIYLSPVKEPRFFSFGDETRGFAGPGDQEVERIVIKSQSEYLKLFREVRDQKAIGEASVDYMSSPLAAERIAQVLPRVKLIAVLRDPVERAYSNFLHVVRQGREPLMDFAAACREEPHRIRAGWMYFWHYLDTGFYFRHLKRYFDRFAEEQILVVLYEDFREDNQEGLRKIFRFLEIDENFVPDTSRNYNENFLPSPHFLRRWLYYRGPMRTLLQKVIPKSIRPFLKKNLAVFFSYKKQALPEDLGTALRETFREDILQLQCLIKRDLSRWLFPIPPIS